MEPGYKEYTYYEKMGYGGILGAFVFILTAEGFGVSVLLHKWNSTIALIHLILSIYMIVFLIADYKVMKKNPIKLGDGKLLIRHGLRVKAEISIHNIDSIQNGKENFEKEKRKREVLDLSLIGFDEPDFEIVLKKPEVITDFLGRKIKIKKIFLSIDQKEEFLQECYPLVK